jgi:class 3 adenylate cyclase
MSSALARHDRILREAVAARDGYVFSSGGDGLAAAFSRSADAVAAAVTAQRALQTESWPPDTVLRVRMGLHTGEAEERDGNYFGSPLNRAARLMAAAQGGQIVVSEVTATLIGHIDGFGLIDLSTASLARPG